MALFNRRDDPDLTWSGDETPGSWSDKHPGLFLFLIAGGVGMIGLATLQVLGVTLYQ
jgi:hypothetical protein